jgi:trehalose 6-phosphate phosphatase
MLGGVAATADALLDRLAERPGETGLFLDFDGVLAPIVDRPEDAYPPQATRDELRRLAARYALVAIVSGRDGGDVRARVNVAGLVYVGSHGLELNPEAEAWRQRLVDFASSVAWPHEPKRLTLAFHYRDAVDEAAAVRELDAVAQRARDEGFVTRFGRKVLEVLPPLAADKGTAVRQLREERGLQRALVAGDDTTDLDAFHAVDELPCAVRVAVASPESPALLRESAEIVVESTDDFLALLRRL